MRHKSTFFKQLLFDFFCSEPKLARRDKLFWGDSVEKKEALLRSLVELKAAHDHASKELAAILRIAANASKGSEIVPSLAELRQYKDALAAAKTHATQAEIVLVEYSYRFLPSSPARFICNNIP
jgi:uncharacterized protein YfcZ (UPF0381/DUF406 family)